MQIYCDTHVHCYQFEQLSNLLDSAQHNFQLAGEGDARVLFFTDGVHDRTWRTLLPLARQQYRTTDWLIRYSEQTQFIHATKEDRELLLAPARQINSKARLEYLLLGCDTELEDGLDDEAILSNFTQDYTVINPWGVGKWLGARGALLSLLIEKYHGQFLLGDNGGRPKIWGSVPQFKINSIQPLNGSDPLPIEGELDRVASYGVTLEVNCQDLTLATLLAALKSGEHQNYGEPMSLARFLRGRLAMAMR